MPASIVVLWLEWMDDRYVTACLGVPPVCLLLTKAGNTRTCTRTTHDAHKTPSYPPRSLALTNTRHTHTHTQHTHTNLSNRQPHAGGEPLGDLSNNGWNGFNGVADP